MIYEILAASTAHREELIHRVKLILSKLDTSALISLIIIYTRHIGCHGSTYLALLMLILPCSFNIAAVFLLEIIFWLSNGGVHCHSKS